MTAKNKKTLSDKYKNQLVNLYTQIVESNEDLEHLLSRNKEQYNNLMGTKINSEASFKQHKVKMRAIRKHADAIENEYRARGKGSLASQTKEGLRDYSSVFLQLPKLPKSISIKTAKPKSKFMDIADAIKDKHNLTEKQAVHRTRDLLRVPRKDYKKLNKRDREILTQYGY